MKKSTFLVRVSVLVSLLLAILPTQSVYAANLVVNTAVDELITNGKCSLREAIINANNNNQSGSSDCASGMGIDPIAFAANYTITLAGELPLVTSEIVINGRGAAKTIIQASTCNPVTLPGGCTPATYRVFEVYFTGNLTLNGLTVRHGRCGGACTGNGDRGGGIHSAGGPLTVTNSTISGNSATDAGGGISSGGPLAVTNSTISRNSAPTGGGIFIGDNDLNLMSSTISGNSAELGGGIFTAAGFAENNVFIINSIFSGNNATNSGGGIYNRNFLTVLESTLSGNSATNGGGGIYNYNGHHLEVIRSTLSGNVAGMGGGIYNDGNLSIGNSTLSGNEAYYYGGGIYSDGSASIYNSTIVFNTLIEGTNLGAGGIDGNVALYNSLVAGNIRLLTSEYRDCSGTIYFEGVSLFWDFTNCTYDPASPGFYGTLYSLNELGPLQDNGGPTWTHALIPIEEGSRAIDAGDNTLCASGPIYNLDQRGVTRPQGSRCDVGAYEAPSLTEFRSGGAQDGWVLETSENSNQGGAINAAAATFLLGDHASNRQYRTILHFNTAALPDDAVITKVVLRIKRQSLVGTNPFTTHGKIAVDIRKGAFSNLGALQATDFQAAASKPGVGVFANNPQAGGWYVSPLKPIAYPHLNRTGITQFRLRFQTDDDNDALADIIKFHSGNSIAANRPVLVIEYYVP